MHLRLTVIIWAFITFPAIAYTQPDTLVIQSFPVTPYDEVVQGFQAACSCEITRLVLSESSTDDLPRLIQSDQHDLILAVGQHAFNAVKQLKNQAIIVTMVLHPEIDSTRNPNVSGVAMIPSPNIMITKLLNTLPEIRSIGTVYDPAHSQSLVDQGKAAAQNLGVQLVARPVHSSRAIPKALRELGKNCDAFWMLPDITVITPDTIESILLFSLDNGIPILTFSEKYLNIGAFMSVGFTPYDIGLQAGEMAKKIRKQDKVVKPGISPPKNAITRINRKVGDKLHLTIAPAAFETGEKTN